MEKMRMETPDLTAVNVEKIGELFPNCVTETKDENGNLKKAINFDLLRQNGCYALIIDFFSRIHFHLLDGSSYEADRILADFVLCFHRFLKVSV